MSKHTCRVVGHRLVKRGELEVLEVRLSNVDGMRCTLIADPNEQDSYPLGSEASLGFTIQQSLPLEAGAGGRALNGSGEKPRRGRKPKDVEPEPAHAEA